MSRRAVSLSWIASLLFVVSCTGANSPTPTMSPTPTARPSSTPSLTAAPSAPTTGPATSQAPQTSRPPSPGQPPAGSPGTSGSPPALEWRELIAFGGPSPREDHTWTVATDGLNAYLFGGRSAESVSDELWRFDLQTDTWMRLEPAADGPAARFGHSAAWVEGVGVVIWAGQAGARFFDDLWAYDPIADAWRLLPATGDVPPARYGSCASLGPDNRLWISHGFTADSGRFSDTRAYDFSTGVWTDETVSTDRPIKRCLHDCLWTPDARLMLYGGQTSGVPAIGDLWTYQPDDHAWTEASVPPLGPRQLYALAAIDETAYVFGGRDVDGEVLDDLWQLDLAGLGWTALAPGGSRPTGRAGATLVSDPVNQRLLLFGGTGPDGALSDLWQLELGAPPTG